MTWTIARDLSAAERYHFGGAQTTFKLSGDLINESKTNFTQRVELEGRRYYVKRYFRPGKHLRRYLGFSRVTREWRNLNWFKKHSIPTCRVVAMGQGNRWFGEYWGVIVTEEVSQTVDLKKLFRRHPEILEERSFRLTTIKNLASVVAAMHRLGFIHNDLQWRNILVTTKGVSRSYLIDCPAGRRIYLLGNRRGIVRDLALLDKMAQDALSKADRLRFYLSYVGAVGLTQQHKKEIVRILRFLRR